MRDHRGFDDGVREVPTRGRDWRCALFVSKNTNAEIDIRRGWISAESSETVPRIGSGGSRERAANTVDRLVGYFGEEMAQLVPSIRLLKY